MSTTKNLPTCRRANRMAQFEPMEQRTMMSGTYFVNNTSDSGAGSLRDAITQVNNGVDTVVDFNIAKSDRGYNASTGLWTINLQSELPAINKAATIDGYSQAGYSNTPLVEIDGDKITSPSPGFGFVGLLEQGGNTTIRGLSFDNFGVGVWLRDTGIGGDVVDGNAFGAHAGVRGMYTAISSQAPSSAIGQTVGNTINFDSNTTTGILLTNASYDTVSHNSINANGNVNTTTYGILLQSGSTGNTLSNNFMFLAGTGIDLDATSGSNTLVGNGAREGLLAGIRADSAGNTIGVIGNGNTIDDTSAGSTTGDGIVITNSQNTIGGNTITDNYGYGIHLETLSGSSVTASNNTIQGNKLSFNDAFGGTSAAQIFIEGGAHGNLVGGYDNTADANVLTNGLGGVSVSSNSFDNAIVGNSISVASGKGINLNNSGNSGDTAPTITSAVSSTLITTIAGTVHSAANSTVRVELFASSAGSVAQGQTYLGAETVSTDANGNATFSDIIPGRYGGDVITATATVSRPVFTNFGMYRFISYVGETSEFSSGVTDMALPIFPITKLSPVFR